MKLFIFKSDCELWCFHCDDKGKILNSLPEKTWHYIGSNIKDVSLIARTTLKGTDYADVIEIDFCVDEDIRVVQNGLIMRLAEEYGSWNDQKQSFEKLSI